MASKTYTQTIQFKGTFDGSQILSSWKRIRSEMGKAGVDNSLFKNVDKDIANAEKLVQNLTAQIQKGFSNPKEITGFERELNKLSLVFNKISVGFQDINKEGNFNINSNSILEAQKALQGLINRQEELEQAAQQSVAAQLESIKLRKSEREEILKEVKIQGELEEAVKKVAKEKEQAAKAKIGKEALATDEGKALADRLGRDVTLTAEDLGLKATNKAKKRGHEDIRQRTDNNRIIRDAAGNQILDEDKGTLAILEEYPKVLQKVIESGGNAADAIELMKKAMDDYGAEITETDKLQESFVRDLDEFYNTGLTESQQKRFNRARILGRTDSSGRTDLSSAGQDIVNNADVTAMNQNNEAISQQQAELSAQQAAAVEEAIQENERLKGVIEQLNAEIAKNNAQNEENTNELKETAEASEDLASHFDDLKQNLKSLLSIGGAISAIKQAINETVTDIKELDKSFASIAMVTNYSVSEMWESYDSYADMANRLGQSTKDVIASSALFYQQGLDTAESLKLTESTMKLATLAGSDFETATSQMTAALRGFKMEMDEGERITDVYSELAAKAAADVNDIAYAMSKTASIASSAGMEFETTSAFLTQMIEV